MGIQTTNQVSKLVLQVGVETAAVAWAATAITSPMGALGGALFGAVRSISRIPLHMFNDKFLNINHPQANSAAKILGVGVVFFGSFAAAWGALAATGITLTVNHMYSLALVSTFTQFAIELFLACLAPDPLPVLRR